MYDEYDFFGTEDVDITEVDMDSLQKDAENPEEDYFDQEFDTKQGDEATEGELIEQVLDPVKATEHFIRNTTGMTAEDLDTIEDEVTEQGEEIGERNAAGDYDDEEVSEDADMIGDTEVSEDPDDLIEGAGDEGEEYEDIEYSDDEGSVSAGTEIATESLNFMLSLEDEGEEGEGGSSDLELDVKYNGKEKNISLNGDSVAIKDGDSGMDDDSYGSDDESDDDDESEDGEDGGDDESDDDKSGESWLFSNDDSWI